MGREGKMSVAVPQNYFTPARVRRTADCKAHSRGLEASRHPLSLFTSPGSGRPRRSPITHRPITHRTVTHRTVPRSRPPRVRRTADCKAHSRGLEASRHPTRRSSPVSEADVHGDPSLPPVLENVAEGVDGFGVVLGVGFVVAHRFEVGRHVHVVVREEGVDAVLDVV